MGSAVTALERYPCHTTSACSLADRGWVPRRLQSGAPYLGPLESPQLVGGQLTAQMAQFRPIGLRRRKRLKYGSSVTQEWHF